MLITRKLKTCSKISSKNDYMQKYIMMNVMMMVLLAIGCQCISMKIIRNREYCFGVQGPELYEMEYMSSGEGEENVHWRVEEQEYVSQYQGTFHISGKKGTFCFHTLDTHPKTISFDFAPALTRISSSPEQILLGAHRSMDKLYRNQHFYLEASRTHQLLLNDTQLKLTLVGAWKLVLIMICGTVQLCMVKRFIDQKGNVGYVESI